MKRKLFTALVVIAALSLTACGEDSAMEEMDQLIQDTELSTDEGATVDNGNGNGNGDGGNGNGGVGGN